MKLLNRETPVISCDDKETQPRGALKTPPNDHSTPKTQEIITQQHLPLSSVSFITTIRQFTRDIHNTA